MKRLQSPSIACLLTLLAPLSLPAQVVIHEIHYAPADKTRHEEFIELHNHGDGEVDVSGWYFSDGVDFTFPEGTVIAPGGFLVVAQDPTELAAIYGLEGALGPFAGRLDNDGELLVLRSHDGFRQDEVDYRNRFPWPVAGRPNDFSIELVHPELDNDLGGSWRPSDPGLDDSRTLVPAGSVWRFLKGTSEASSPVGTWRERGFDDSGWTAGRASIGYGEGVVVTSLDDMRGGYSSVFLRQEFDVPSASAVPSLVLEVQYDDGFNAWINGVHVAGDNVASEEMPHDANADSALENLEFVGFPLPPPDGYLVDGPNVLAIQLHNASLAGSSDAFLDARLVSSAGGAGPSPGRQNTMHSAESAPLLRQVDHAPREPMTGDPVAVTIKATDADGVGEVVLEYQVVEPGAYIRLEDPEYEAGWDSIAMNDLGIGGDEAAGDSIFTAIVPPGVQSHRRLVRYRITAADATGLSITAPFPEDPQPNFAYFVHDGVPAWQGAVRPGTTPTSTYSSELLTSLPVYHLITRRQDRLDAMHVPYRSGQGDQERPTSGEYWGSDYPWSGTLVYDGEVYDHVRFRARGGVWRYSMGKNMWKFDFLRGHYFQARDDYGRRYDTTWDKLNFSALIQQGNFRQRGEQGLFEGAGFRLHNLAGNAAPKTHYVHFRVVDGESEEGPDQYSGDFRGLYMVLEQMDGRFLDEHGLPDGNLYKMEGGTGELNNQGPDQPTDKSDLNAFMSAYRSSPGAAWWEQNLDLPDYYGFRSIASAIHDYDIHAGKNYFYFNNPETGKWQVFNWDLDLTWTTTYGGGGERGPLNQYVLDPFPEFRREHANRMRELRDLLFNPEQTGILLDEVAHVVYTPGELSFVDADRAMWDYNPILVSSYINSSKAGHGRYYEASSSRTFAGMIQFVKSWVGGRGSYLDTSFARDTAIPRRPTVEYIGAAGHPLDDLRFRASEFSDPQGSGTFAAMRWRAAEISPPDAPPFDPLAPKVYEIDAAWESPDLTSYEAEVQIPSGALRVGRRYRVRVRMMDDSGRWSHWSDPVELEVGPPTAPFPQQETLRITEIMYHPAEGADHEFIELQNIGDDWVDLRPVSFTNGIDFDFASGRVEELGPGEIVVVVENEAVFRSVYDATDIAVAGEYEGRLSNGGERIVLTFGSDSAILDFGYVDEWYPITDGGGHSLTIVDPFDSPLAWGDPSSWTVSSEPGGSPGAADGSGPVGGRQRPGDANQDGYLDLSDGIRLLQLLFTGGAPLPCEGALVSEGANRALLDVNGDLGVDVSDAVFLLEFLFLDGAPPALGTRCVRIEGCPNACGF